jgi:hypothetical protein
MTDPEPGEIWENRRRPGDLVTVDEVVDGLVKYHRDNCPCCHKPVESGRTVKGFMRMYRLKEG